MSNIDVAVERPLLFLILIPALLLGIIPFLRLNKRRRASIKHLVPFILHLSLVFILSALLAGITVTETTDERLSTKVVFVVDVSDSNRENTPEMDKFMREIIEHSDLEKDKFGLVLFAKGDFVVLRDQNPSKETVGLFDINSPDYFSDLQDIIDEKLSESTATSVTDGTDISVAISRASELFVEEYTNKKMIVLSDGLETMGDSITVAKMLDDGIQVSGAYFNMVGASGRKDETQLISVNTNGRVLEGEKVKVEFVIKTTVKDAYVKLVVEDGDIVTEKIVSLPNVGKENAVGLEYLPEKSGVNTIKASVIPVTSKGKPIDGKDTITMNNTLYSWYSLDAQRKILIVDGDAKSDRSQYEQIKNSLVSEDIEEFYGVEVCSVDDFPANLEGLLRYDQIVMMDVDFSKLRGDAGADLKRYVEEIGRGLFFSFGDSLYSKSVEDAEQKEEFKEIPKEIEELLPVKLELGDEKQTVGMVLVVDLSSSMGHLMDGKSRFEIVIEGVKKMLMLGAEEETEETPPEEENPDDELGDENDNFFDDTEEEDKKEEDKAGFDSEDYIGVICFDADAFVAQEMVQIGDLENRKKLCEDVEWQLRHYYYHHYYDKKGNVTDIPVGRNDGDKYTSQGYVKPSGIKEGTYDQQTNWYIKSYGTQYKWAIQEASDMLDDQSDKTMLHIKQVLFMSDGAPTTTSGYINIVERMANSGVKISTIAAGLDLDTSKQDTQKKELMKIANAGKGDFLVAETADALTENLVDTAKSVTADLINLRPVLPKENSLNSSLLQGIHAAEDEEKFQPMYGYFSSTIKEGADLILYVDRMKPLYAEWQCGLGKVAAFMSDFSDPQWTGALFDENYPNGRILVSNMFDATMNKEVSSTGLQYSVTRDGNDITVTVETPVELRSNETLSLQAIDSEGGYSDPVELTQVAVKKYRAKFTMDDVNDAYTMQVFLKEEQFNKIKDAITFAVNGSYSEEFDVFKEGGESTLDAITGSAGGEVITGGEGFFSDIENKIQVFNHDVTTPVIIAVLVIFMLDILFRNIVFNRKKDKQPEMSEEDRIASMRGR